MTDTVIQVQGLGKRYNIGKLQRDNEQSIFDIAKDTFQSSRRALRSLINPGSFQDDDAHIWALRDIDFSVQRGETLGIIGHNGAGKSTLLKILTRITDPTEGEIRLRGRVGALLEVGTGFNGMLSGRENIYLNGAILGMTKNEIDHKFDEIVDFAGVEKFIDTPVRHYSSGMYLRLAFAVAAHLEPEILLVDEVLAVGDAAFQKKCLGKMNQVSDEGRTVLFVSHDMMAIQELCSRAIMLDSGNIVMDGDAHEVVQEHLKQSMQEFSQLDSMDLLNAERHAEVTDSKIRFHSFYLVDAKGTPSKSVRYGDHLHFHMDIESHETFEDLSIGIILSNQQDVNIIIFNSDAYGEFFSVNAGQNVHVQIEVPNLYLTPGSYNIKGIEVRHRHGAPLDHVVRPMQFDILHAHATQDLPRPGKKALLSARANWQIDVH